jgi:hypothetical protein
MTMSPPTDNRLDTRFLAGSPPAASTLASVPQIGLQSCHQSARAKSRPPVHPCTPGHASGSTEQLG